MSGLSAERCLRKALLASAAALAFARSAGFADLLALALAVRVLIAVVLSPFAPSRRVWCALLCAIDGCAASLGSYRTKNVSGY